MIILHGDHQPNSRQRLTTLTTEANAHGVNITRVEAATLTPNALEIILGRDSLFGTTELVIIEGLHSLPASQQRKTLIQLLTQHTQNPNLIIWENKSLTATQLKIFQNAKIEEFKIKKLLFTWMDSLSPQTDKARLLTLFHQVTDQEPVEFIFLMLARQIRLLIQTKEGISPPSGSPFMLSKLRHQAQFFTLEQLLKLHSQLLKIDLDQKNGKSQLDLKAQLDLWQISL